MLFNITRSADKKICNYMMVKGLKLVMFLVEYNSRISLKLNKGT